MFQLTVFAILFHLCVLSSSASAVVFYKRHELNEPLRSTIKNTICSSVPNGGRNPFLIHFVENLIGLLEEKELWIDRDFKTGYLQLVNQYQSEMYRRKSTLARENLIATELFNRFDFLVKIAFTIIHDFKSAIDQHVRRRLIELRARSPIYKIGHFEDKLPLPTDIRSIRSSLSSDFSLVLSSLKTIRLHEHLNSHSFLTEYFFQLLIRESETWLPCDPAAFANKINRFMEEFFKATLPYVAESDRDLLADQACLLIFPALEDLLGNQKQQFDAFKKAFIQLTEHSPRELLCTDRNLDFLHSDVTHHRALPYVKVLSAEKM